MVFQTKHFTLPCYPPLHKPLWCAATIQDNSDILMDRKQTCYNIMISSHGFTRRNRFQKDTHEFLRMHRKWIRVKEASWYARGRIVLVGQQNILKFRKFHPKPIFLASPENSEESTNMEHSHSFNDSSQLAF